MAKQLIMLSFEGENSQAKELEEALQILLQYAQVNEIITLAGAVKRNPKLIKNALKFIG